MTEKVETWAIVFPNNRVVADCDFMDEAHAWTVALGWPSDEEIEDAKRKGYRAMLLTIDLNEQTAKPIEAHETGNMSNKGWIAADEVNALVQQLDVLLNGEAGAARQASLCDIVAQVARMRSQSAWPPECEALCKAAEAIREAENHLWLSDNPEEAVDGDEIMDPEEARESHSEAWEALNTAIHYMRKRMERPFLFSKT